MLCSLFYSTVLSSQFYKNFEFEGSVNQGYTFNRSQMLFFESEGFESYDLFQYSDEKSLAVTNYNFALNFRIDSVHRIKLKFGRSNYGQTIDIQRTGIIERLYSDYKNLTVTRFNGLYYSFSKYFNKQVLELEGGVNQDFYDFTNSFVYGCFLIDLPAYSRTLSLRTYRQILDNFSIGLSVSNTHNIVFRQTPDSSLDYCDSSGSYSYALNYAELSVRFNFK